MIYLRNLQVNVVLLLIFIKTTQTCIKLLNSEWQPLALHDRTKRADVVVTAKILYTSPIPSQYMFYSATFEIISVLKGIELIKQLHKDKSNSILSLDPKIIASAKGFGDSRLCFSSVEVGESYALFLGFKHGKKNSSNELVAKYDDIFGAADLLYKRTERDILQTLGWEEWTGWNKCSKTCSSGVQERQRKCRYAEGTCRGPSKELRECNTFSCEKSFDLLSFITQYESDYIPAWQRSGEVYTNGVDQKSPSSAPTYLLFPNIFPSKPVIRITFKGPIVTPQFLFSIFDANSKMILGIRVTAETIDLIYTDRNLDKQKKKNVVYELNENIWYDLSVLITPEEIKLKINCDDLHHINIENEIFENMDIYGMMYLGASSNEGAERFVRAEMTQISVIDNPPTFWHQCGKLILGNQEDVKTSEGESGISGDGVDGPDDSESGDVDEDFGSGENRDCSCQNGGVCKYGRCRCAFGWEGEHCNKPICKSGCLNGGVCIKPNTCKCTNGTYGNSCQFSNCQLPCKNNGTCIGYNQCKCKHGFNGPQCQNKVCSTMCMNGASCTSNGKCVCTEGYTGDKCQNKQKCKEYVIKLVSYLRPATVYTYVTETFPCVGNERLQCKKKRLKYQQINQIDYRQDYICKT